MSKKNEKGGSAVKWVLGGLAAVVLLVAGLYVAAYFIAGNRVPEKASVAGVPIGGLSPAQAEDKLHEELEANYAKPIAVADDQGHKFELAPLDSGFGIDYAATVRNAGGGFSWNPVDIMHAFTGGEPVDLVTTYQADELKAVLQAEAARFKTDAKDATLSYGSDGTIQRTDSTEATSLDIDQTAERVKTAFESRAPQAEAVIDRTEPAVTTKAVDEAVKTFAEPAISGPITVSDGKGSYQVTPAQVAAVTTLSFKDGKFSHTFDGKKLWELTADARKALDTGKPRNASYKFDAAGAIVVVPAVDGATLEEPAVSKAVEEVLTKTGEARKATVEPVAQKAEFTTEEATKLKPREVIGQFTTQYPHASYRNNNLGKAASTVSGTVLMPGQTFSLNDTLGERTEANGYVDGYVINGGVLVKEPGGGISQSATTLFNAAFFAGYEDVEHKPHSLYFPRYPAGREATVYYGKIDLRFKNNTDYPAIIQGYINPSSSGKQGSITFKIWSIPTWEKVTSTDLVKSNYYSGTTRVNTAANCEPQAAIEGFTVNWQRQFWKGGKVVKSEPFKWTYDAGDRITCS